MSYTANIVKETLFNIVQMFSVGNAIMNSI